MGSDDQQLLWQFADASLSVLANAEAQIKAIETGAAEADATPVTELFKGTYSIHRTASFLGLQQIHVLARQMQLLLGEVLNRTVAPSSHIADTMLRSTEMLRQMVRKAESSNEIDVSEYLVDLRSVSAA